MTKRFMNPKGKILVAVDLEQNSIPILTAAGELAERSGLGLAAVHVSEYWVGRTWPTDLMLGGPIGGLATAVEEETMKASKAHLHELVETALPQWKIKEDVLLGYPTEAIRAHAVTIGAEMILVGGVAKEYKFVPQGLSTLLGLLGDAPCPVLVLPKDRPGSWSKDRLKILLADDLTTHTEGAVMVGYEWAAALGKVDFMHVHVNHMTKDDLKYALDAAAASAHSPLGAINTETIWIAAMDSIETSMANRAPGRKQFVEARGGTVTTRIVEGQPTDAVIQLATTENIDMMVFGRHRTWRKKPFGFGQMPFHSMLKANIPILVADH